MACTTVNTTPDIREILRSSGIVTPIADVLVNESSATDEGMGSRRQYVTVKFENPHLPPLHLFTKTLIRDNPSHLEINETNKSFIKEATFLTKYLPAVRQLCNDKGFDEKSLLDIYPKCYYGDENFVVLENIVADKGYKLLGKAEPHDFDTTVYALRTLAKHHAISHAMLQEEGDPTRFFQRFPHLNHEGFDRKVFVAQFGPWLQSAFSTNIKLLEIFNSADNDTSEALSRLREFYEKAPSMAELIVDTVTNDANDNELYLLNHGDCWYANMMFLTHPDTNKITHMKLVDFQLTRYNTPALDLSYYLFSSVQTDVRQKRLQELLRAYLDTLNKLSGDLGHPVNLEYGDLLRQYRKKRNFGFIVSSVFQYGPGMALFKNTDMTKIELTQWGDVTDKLAREWIAENPAEAKRITKEIAKVVLEHAELEWK